MNLKKLTKISDANTNGYPTKADLSRYSDVTIENDEKKGTSKITIDLEFSEHAPGSVKKRKIDAAKNAVKDLAESLGFKANISVNEDGDVVANLSKAPSEVESNHNKVSSIDELYDRVSEMGIGDTNDFDVSEITSEIDETSLEDYIMAGFDDISEQVRASCILSGTNLTVSLEQVPED